MTDPTRALFRHTVATLAYRAAKVVSGAPASFADFQAGEETRTPAEILAHMGDLFDWALSSAAGTEAWHDSKPFAWHQEIERFFATLKAFDDFLASGQPLHAAYENLFQGPLSDALTHVGQLAILRRLAGSPVRGENFFIAEIAPGRVGANQAKPKMEF
jgi:hypothetical protein